MTKDTVPPPPCPPSERREPPQKTRRIALRPRAGDGSLPAFFEPYDVETGEPLDGVTKVVMHYEVGEESAVTIRVLLGWDDPTGPIGGMS